jgi:N-sulfoglucosamine sulfohydrolase
VDKQHFISGIDFMPTALDAAGAADPGGMDGSSFLPVLLGKRQPERDKVFTQFHQTSGRNRYPIRCVQNHRFGYIFNPWADGQRVFRNESQSGLTFNAMKAAAPKDDSVAGRVKLFQYRVVEEFYDFKNDPDGLNNLIDDPDFKEQIEKLRKEMIDLMKKSNDPALNSLENRTSPAALKKFMTEQDARSGRKQKKKQTKKTGNKKQRSG